MHQIRPILDPSFHAPDARRTTAVRTWLQCGSTLILVIALALGLGHAQSGGTDAHTVRIEPSGGDDTAALQDALEACRFASSACRVELAEGTFRTRPLVVSDFHGAVRGAGKDATVIEAMPGIDVVDAEPAVIAVAPTTEEPWPFLLTFIDGDVEVSDLTLRIGEAAPTTGWNFFDSEFDAMVATLLITGTRADAVIERIGVEGAAGNFAGANLINGLYIQGVMPNPDGPWSIDSSPPLQGTFVVRDSTFTNAAFNLATTNLVDSLVLIEGNTFDESPVVDGGASDIDLLDSSNTVTIVRDNRLNGVRGMGIHFVQGEFLTDLEPSLFLVSGNQIRARSVGQAIVLSDNIYGAGGEPTLDAIVSGNSINLSGESHAVFTTASAGVRLLGNRLGGAGRAGITLGTPYGADEIAKASGWTVAGNDLTNLDVRGPGVVLGEGAHDTTVVCGPGGRVEDGGTDTTLLCEP